MEHLIDRYHQRINRQLDRVQKTQYDACVAAGKMIAESVANGGCIHVFDTGHIIDSELIYRGGGLLLLKRFKYALNVEDEVRTRDRSAVSKDMTGLAGYALRASGALPGDVMILGSVSGKTPNVVDLAIEARKFGMKTIAVTSLEYSRSVASEHSSGKRLFECCDIVLDNCTPAAEAMMEVEGLDARFAAASGLSAATLLWSVCAVTIEELLARGIKPSVLKSQNFEDGPEFNEELKKIYANTGF